ncbi:hypothetical protein DFH29DRAFT_870868 [Suillus ampliporus]|nr:hypothetical protein DFH29DRAFT_870868 [Suillus ampliporus]
MFRDNQREIEEREMICWGPEVAPKRKKKVTNLLLHEAISAARMKQNESLAHTNQPGRSVDAKAHASIDQKGNISVNKKFNLSGKINNWCKKVEPGSKHKSPQAASVSTWSGTSIPCSTIDSNLKPPPTPTKEFQADNILTISDTDESDSDSKECAAAIAVKEKGKAALKNIIEIRSGPDPDNNKVIMTEAVTKTIVGVNKRSDNLQDVEILTPFADLPYSRQAEIISLALEQTEPQCTVSFSKRKFEKAINNLSKEEEMYHNANGDYAMTDNDTTSSDDETNLKAISPDVKEVLKANNVVHTTAKTSMMVSEKAKVLPNLPAKKIKSEPRAKKVKSELTSQVPMTLALAAPQAAVPVLTLADMTTKPATGHILYNVSRSKAQYPIQGPYHGHGHPVLVYLAQDSSDKDEEEDGIDNENDSVDTAIIAMACNLSKNYAFLFVDPDTYDPSEIYHSVFMLQLIAMAHLNTITGFVNVPELNTHVLASLKMESVVSACAVAIGK